MGKQLVTKIRGMNPLAKQGVLLLLAFLVSFACMSGPKSAEAAITVLNPFQAGGTAYNVNNTYGFYKGTAVPGAAAVGTIAPAAGSDRVLVVAVSSAISAAATQTCSVTYNSVSMTQAIGDGTNSARQHSYLFYLPLGTSASAGAAVRPVVTITGGTVQTAVVTSAVFAGVDQTTVVRAPSKNYNGGTSTTTTVGPFAAPLLAINAGDYAVEIVQLFRTNSTNPRTISTWATGWSITALMTGTYAPVTQAGTSSVSSNVYVRGNTTATAGTNSQHTSSGTSLKTMSAMVLIPTGVTVATGTNVAAQNVYAGNSGKVVNSFTMSGSGTVTGITITGNANTTTTNVSAVKIYRKGAANTNMSAVETGDTQIGSGTASTTTTTIPVSETVSALTNYIVVYDIATTAVANAATISLAGTVSALTPAAATLVDTNTPAAPLTILATTTVETGVENPASSRLWVSSTPTNIDAFTLSHNGSASDNETTINNITVALTPNLISGSGSVWSKFKLLEITTAAGVPLGSLDKVTLVDAWNIPVSGLTVTSTPTTYYVRGTTADVINPSATDTSGTVSGFYPDPAIMPAIKTQVTALTGAKNLLVYNDSASSAAVIDVEKPADGTPSAPIAVTGANPGEISLSWPAATDDHSGSLDPVKPYKIMRSVVNGATPNPGCLDGTDISATASINYSSRTATDVGLNQTPSQNYAYRICAVDAQGNVSTGITGAANAGVLNICYLEPTVEISPLSQLIKSVDTIPFRLAITNRDIGTCSDAIFNLELVNESATKVDFDKAISINGVDYSFPTTVTLGTGGTSAQTGLTMYVKMTGKPQASQLEQYSFAVKVTNGTHNGVFPGGPYTYTTPTVTGLLNDMPPIVHNANNMAKKQYTVNDVDWGATYTCATCHSNSTTNIKGIYQLISTPIGRRNVVFTTISSTEAQSIGVYGNDKREVKNVSSNVCEVCHHRTRQHQYSANKVYGGPNNNELYTSDHHNSRDCVACHTHNTAFRSIYGVCGDCHGYKASGYSPVSRETMVRDPLTNALGPAVTNYGAHQRHYDAKISCQACHNNTNHGLLASTWSGDNSMQIGFTIDKDTFNGFNPTASFNSGVFNGTNRLNTPYVWQAGPGTTVNVIDDYNNSCTTYCHGSWSGNVGAKTNPFWVGDSAEIVCGNCHYATGANPPVSGSHQKHALSTGVGLGISCNKCHGTYSNYTGLSGSAHINGNVEWTFASDFTTNGAQYKPAGAASGTSFGSTGNPAPSAGFGTCSQLYCHSNVQGLVNGTGAPTAYATAKWGDASTAQCGSCHAMPNTSGSHNNHENATVGFDCHVCHDNGGTTTATNHANGKINMRFVGLGQNTKYFGMSTINVTPGTAYGQCSTSDCHGRSVRTWGTLQSPLTMCEKCHGSATSAGGFYSTNGPGTSMSIYSAGVGVHDIHIQNPNSPRKATFTRFTSYASGYDCNQCHTVPTGPFSAGHIDTALPAEVPFNNRSSIASKGKAVFGFSSTATYNSADQSCSSVWCHGGGMNSNRAVSDYAGTTPPSRTNPTWNQPILAGTSADCSKCHASPPPAPNASYTHYGKTLSNCYECHFHVNQDGTSFNNKSLHANGKIEGGCTDCHGDPPINATTGGPNGLVLEPAQNAINPSNGAGAHNAHQLLSTIGDNCNTCHNNYNKIMRIDGTGRLEISFNGLGGLVTTGTFTGYTNSVNGPKWTTTGNTALVKSGVQAAVCSNLYCHGGGDANAIPSRPALGGGNNTAPNWQVPAVCGDCHGIDSANAPTGGSHTRHATQIPSIVCANCHGATPDNGTHVDASVSWHLDNQNPLFGANATYNGMSSGSLPGLAPRGNVTAGDDYRTCSNVYCHSNVQSANGTAGPSDFKSPRWGADNGTMTCGSCHLNMATDAVPTGSHLKHANTTGSGMGVSCGYCHQDAGFGYALHTDGAVFVNFTSYIQLAPNSYSAGTAVSTGMNKTSGTAAYGTCSTTFCHGTATSPAWGAPGPLACNACHGAKVNSPNWSGRHATHYGSYTAPTTYNETLADKSLASKYVFNCSHCHDADSTKHSLKPQSVNSAARVFYGISTAIPATSSKRGVYSYGGTANSKTDNGFKFTAGTCNTTYCHSDGKGGAPKVAFLNWTTTPVAAGQNCLFCHDGKSATATASTLSGKHDKHMNPLNNAMIGTGNGFNCVDCHAPTVGTTNNTLVTDKRRHVNSMVDYSGIRANKGLNTSVSKNGECTNIYCHSNGNPNATVFVSMTGSKNWNGSSTITTCNKCHGRATGNTLGVPDYANGGTGAGIATANLHPGHLAGMADTRACADCHRKTVDSLAVNKFRPYSTTHLSGGANVNFDKAKTYVGSMASQSTVGMQVTCSNIVCHGQATPVWGGAKAGSTVTAFGAASVRTCTKCHGAAASAYSSYSSSVIAPGGAGTDTSMTKTLATDPRVGAHQRHLATNVISAPVKCGECHVVLSGASDAAAMRSANHWNYSTATITFGALAKSNGHTSATSGKPSGTLTQCSNVYCHTGASNTGATPAPFWNMTGMVSEGANTVSACIKCHAMPPQTGTHLNNAVKPMSNISSISTTYTRCNGCHYNVSSSAANVGNVFTDKKLHVNGGIEVQMNCNSCHSYLPTDSWTSTYGTEGIGAHVKHINYLLTRNPGVTLNAATDTFGGTTFKAICGVCHTNEPAQHTTATPSNPRSIIFGSASTSRAFGPLHAKYNGASGFSSSVNPKSCSNTDCHYKTSPIWSTY